MNFLIHSLTPTLLWYKLGIKDKWLLALSILGGLMPDLFTVYEKLFVGWGAWEIRALGHEWLTFAIVSGIVLSLLWLIKEWLTTNIYHGLFLFSLSYAFHILVDILIHKPIVGGYYDWAWPIDMGLTIIMGIYFWKSKEWPWTWFMNKQ